GMLEALGRGAMPVDRQARDDGALPVVAGAAALRLARLPGNRRRVGSPAPAAVRLLDAIEGVLGVEIGADDDRRVVRGVVAGEKLARVVEAARHRLDVAEEAERGVLV